MSNDDIAGSAQINNRVQFGRRRIGVLREERARASTLGVSHEWTARPPAANDNQLAWPCLAFAEDWYASC